MIRAAIIIDNTKSRILKLKDTDFLTLRETVIFFDKKRYAMATSWVKKNRRDSFKTYMIDTDGFFPTGIIPRVKHFLEARGISVDVLDNRVVPKMNTETFRMKIKEPTAYSDQAKCTAALLKAGQGIGQLPTGVGKTRVIKDNIQQLGTRSLIITPSTNLREQTVEYLEDCFGSDMAGVYDPRFDKKPITVMNYHSVEKTDPREWDDYHHMAFDEFHNAVNNTIRGFNSTHLNSFYFRYGLTATNFTASDDSAILLESVLSNTVYSMSIYEAIQKNYILPIQPIFFDLQNGHLKTKNNYSKDYKVFMDNNDEKNQIIRDTMDKMLAQGLPSITLVKHIDHGKALAGDHGCFLSGQDAKAKENMKRIDEFNDLKIPQIVGTSVIGEGINTVACAALINGKGGKSKKELLQNIGRCVRKREGKHIGFYFDFIDRGQKNLYQHSRARIKFIREEFKMEPKVIKL